MTRPIKQFTYLNEAESSVLKAIAEARAISAAAVLRQLILEEGKRRGIKPEVSE